MGNACKDDEILKKGDYDVSLMAKAEIFLKSIHINWWSFWVKKIPDGFKEKKYQHINYKYTMK